MKVIFVSLVLLLLLTAVTEMIRQTNKMVEITRLLLANIFPYLGVDHGVVFPDSVGPDEGDQRHLGHTETVIRRLLLFVGCPGN